MKDKIKDLIDKQLGDINNFSTVLEAASYIIGTNVHNYMTAHYIVKQEQSRRELLAALMEEICWDEAYERNIEVIEKTLSMPWRDIVKYLED